MAFAKDRVMAFNKKSNAESAEVAMNSAHLGVSRNLNPKFGIYVPYPVIFPIWYMDHKSF